MKNRKLIIASAAAVLSIAVIGTSIALYQKVDAEQSFHITTSTSTEGAFTLEQTTTSTDAYSAFSPEKAIHDEYKMKFSKADYKQDTIVGKLGLKVTSTSAVLDKLSISLSIDGYEANSWVVNGLSKTNTIKNINTTETTGLSEDKKTYILEEDVPMFIDGTNIAKVDITITDENFLSGFDSADFSYELYLKEETTWEFAYLRGSMTAWDLSDAYKMMPNLSSSATEFEWAYKNFTNETAETIEWKCFKEGESTNGGYIPDPNKELAPGGDVNVYWKGFKKGVAQEVYIVNNKEAA